MLPLVLSGFLALLAVGAVGHALVIAIRRRHHELAVLRALGLTQWQSRLVIATQATVLAMIGLVFGVPLGVALGRALWRAAAGMTPLAYRPPLAVWGAAAGRPAGPAACQPACGLARPACGTAAYRRGPARRVIRWAPAGTTWP